MIGFVPPSIVFRAARWSSEELTARAISWRAHLASALPTSAGPIAMVMTNHPQSVAAFFALSSFDSAIALLPVDLKPWLTSPPIPDGTPVVLLPSQAGLAPDLRAAGMVPAVLPARSEADAATAGDGASPFMSMPGVILFTSGSTGRPRAVYRSRRALVDVAKALVTAVGLRRGDAVVTSLPVARAFGLNHGLMAATLTGGSLALLDNFDHYLLLRLFASEGYRYWACTPMMADVLSRCALPQAHHAAPELCLVGGVVSGEIAGRFLTRFRVPLRQIYGTTETGTICADTAPPSQVRSGTAGHALPGVSVRIGDDPRSPVEPEVPGRIWLSTPAYLMEGYGFPPALEAAGTVDGWWGTPDVGRLSADGCLTVSGRLDDTFRTSSGHLVSSDSVAAVLEGYPGVAEAAVVSLAGAKGPELALLVESFGDLSVAELRRHLARALPAWSQPRVIELAPALPRLANGRIDRRACIEILQEAAR
jgi:long-chain acyl-CoA synthetase